MYQNSTDLMNDSLKPREVAKASLIPHTQKPTRPEQSIDSSIIVSPNEKIARVQASPPKRSPIKQTLEILPEQSTP